MFSLIRWYRKRKLITPEQALKELREQKKISYNRSSLQRDRIAIEYYRRFGHTKDEFYEMGYHQIVKIPCKICGEHWFNHCGIKCP